MESMNNRIDLVCTDIDGTLLDSGNPDFSSLMVFKHTMDSLRRQWGAKWAIVTGRHRRGMIPIIDSFLGFNLIPDFIVLEDAYIYRFSRRSGWRSFFSWNLQIRWKRARLWRRGKRNLQLWQTEMSKEFPEMKLRSHETVDMWMEFPDPEKAEQAEIILKHKTAESVDFEVFRWGAELFLAPSVGKKGEAVSKIADSLNVSETQIFAVGDGANDINMLEGWAAGMVACVANAPTEIKQIVQHVGGYVASESATAGVVESLRFYLEKPDRHDLTKQN